MEVPNFVGQTIVYAANATKKLLTGVFSKNEILFYKIYDVIPF